MSSPADASANAAQSTLNLVANAVQPHFNLEAILRGDGFGLVKLRQQKDPTQDILLYGRVGSGPAAEHELWLAARGRQPSGWRLHRHELADDGSGNDTAADSHRQYGDGSRRAVAKPIPTTVMGPTSTSA